VWMLVIAILTNQGNLIYNEFMIFESRGQCMNVTAAWMDVPVSGGHIALAACQHVRT
jgi:hypothetical protein